MMMKSAGRVLTVGELREMIVRLPDWATIRVDGLAVVEVETYPTEVTMRTDVRAGRDPDDTSVPIEEVLDVLRKVVDANTLKAARKAAQEWMNENGEGQ